ncbi:hypothetical protein [Prevotella koreensis]
MRDKVNLFVSYSFCNFSEMLPEFADKSISKVGLVDVVSGVTISSKAVKPTWKQP